MFRWIDSIDEEEDTAGQDRKQVGKVTCLFEKCWSGWRCLLFLHELTLRLLKWSRFQEIHYLPKKGL